MNKSDTIGALAKALAAAQAEIEGAKKDAENPFFKKSYADLASVWEAIRKPLSKNDLSITQVTSYSETGVLLETMLMHGSGEWISGVLFFPFGSKTDPQSIGILITYMRRYALMAVTGVAPIDDDAEGVMDRGKPKSLYDEAVKNFQAAKALPHLANYFKKHYSEFEKDPRFKDIVAAKDKRKAELQAELDAKKKDAEGTLHCPVTDREQPVAACKDCAKTDCPERAE